MAEPQPRSTLFLLLDALSAAYDPAENFPRTWKSLGGDATRGTIKPMFAFRGVEATMFTGASPAEHGIWCEYRLDEAAPWPDVRKPATSGPLERAFRVLPDDRAEKLARLAWRRLRGGREFMPNLIPAAYAASFRASLPGRIADYPSIGEHPTLFGQCGEHGRFARSIQPGLRGDGPAVEAGMKAIAEATPGCFLHIKLNALDHLGHAHGPAPERFGPGLAEVDERSARLVTAFREKFPDGAVVVAGDHGMSEVKDTIDPYPVLEQMVQRVGPFLPFLDSTMVRLWFPEPERAEPAADALAKSFPAARVLRPADLTRLGLPADRAQGEVVLALPEGGLVFPNFYQRRAGAKGMHGYLGSTTPASRALLLATEPLPKRELTFADLHGVLAAPLAFDTVEDAARATG